MASAAVAVGEEVQGAQRPFWREALAPYERPRMARTALDLATSILPYAALTALGYLLVEVSALLALALAPLAAGFLLRTYIMFHDCAHGSLLPSKRGTNGWGGHWAWWSSRRTRAGSTATRCITRPRGTSSAGATATCRP